MIRFKERCEQMIQIRRVRGYRWTVSKKVSEEERFIVLGGFGKGVYFSVPAVSVDFSVNFAPFAVPDF